MRIGYLHFVLPSRAQAGLTRYGRLLAAEARRRPGLDVLEVEVALDQHTAANTARLREAARRLREADVVHLQFSRYFWLAGWQQRYYWHVCQQSCPRPLVATLHDVYPYFYPANGWRGALADAREQWRAGATARAPRARGALGVLKNHLFDNLTLRAVLKDCRLALVCTREEQRRALHLAPPGRITVIPHFVEERLHPATRAAARQALGMGGERVVTLQGYLYPNKGHQLLAQALPQLPPEVKVVFAGGPSAGQDDYLRHLQQTSQALGVADRLCITGYLPDEALRLHLAASDLAVCPFSVVSASSSIATWISEARPILASDLPQMAEYNEWAPGAVRTFRPYEAAALAAAILALLPECGDGDDPAVARLREALSMRRMFDRHLEAYRQAAGAS